MNPGEAVKMDSEYRSFLAELGGGPPPEAGGGGGLANMGPRGAPACCLQLGLAVAVRCRGDAALLLLLLLLVLACRPLADRLPAAAHPRTLQACRGAICPTRASSTSETCRR